MIAAAPFEIGSLLEQAGARPRGNRHDCPKCGGLRTITRTDECFYCHKCQWKGNTVSLAKELGLYQRLSPAEYRELRQERERADRAARALYERVKARRFQLLDGLDTLNRLELVAHEAGRDNPATWDGLAPVYGRRPTLLAELAILENGGAADLIRFLSADNAVREWAIKRVIERGGLYGHVSEVVEVGT